MNEDNGDWPVIMPPWDPPVNPRDVDDPDDLGGTD